MCTIRHTPTTLSATTRALLFFKTVLDSIGWFSGTEMSVATSQQHIVRVKQLLNILELVDFKGKYLPLAEKELGADADDDCLWSRAASKLCDEILQKSPVCGHSLLSVDIYGYVLRKYILEPNAKLATFVFLIGRRRCHHEFTSPAEYAEYDVFYESLLPSESELWWEMEFSLNLSETQEACKIAWRITQTRKSF